MPDAALVVIEYDGVVADGKFVEHAVFQQHLHVASHAGVAYLGLDEQAFGVLSEFNGAANGEPAVIVERQNLYALPSFGDCLREGSGLYDVAAVVDISNDGPIPGEDALLLVVVVHVEQQGLVLCFDALLLCPSGEGLLPRFSAGLGRVIIRRYTQVCQRELRRYYRVVCDDVGRRVLRAVSGRFCGHSCGQSFRGYLFLIEVDAAVSGRLCGLLWGEIHFSTS